MKNEEKPEAWLNTFVRAIVFWLSLYLFERSTANMVGFGMSYVVYVGVPALFVDRFLILKEQALRQTGRLYATPDAVDMGDSPVCASAKLAL